MRSATPTSPLSLPPLLHSASSFALGVFHSFRDTVTISSCRQNLYPSTLRAYPTGFTEQQDSQRALDVRLRLLNGLSDMRQRNPRSSAL